VLFFLLAAIPAAIIGVLLTNSAWERQLQTVHEQHFQLARHLATALMRYAEDVDATFQLAVLNLMANRQVHGLTALLQRLHFRHICIVNSSGRVERFISPHAGLVMERVPPPLLQELRHAGAQPGEAPHFSHVLPGLHGHPTIFLWQALSKDQYALGALQTDYFVQLQSAIRFGQHGHAAIVDRRGHIIAHPDPQWRATRKDISSVDPVRRMMAGEMGVSRFFSPALNAEMIAGFTVTPKTGWGVMIPQPIAELEARVTWVKRTIWLVIGLTLLAATLLGGFVSRWLAVPLQRIGLAAERVANGAYDAHVGYLGFFPTSEATSLATQFNAMADEVHRSWQAQQESEQRFREFAQIAADWFWETDLQQVFTYTSPPSETGCYRDAALILGHHRRELVWGDPESKVVAEMQSHMDRLEPFDHIEHQILGSDGQLMHLSISGRPMAAPTGDIVGYRGVAQDITDRLHAEAQLHHAQQERRLRHVRRMEAIGTLAGGIAHDFNNILTAILGYTELSLYDLPQPTSVRRNLQEVLAAGRRAKELVQHILTFSRQSEQERTPVHVQGVVKEALRLLRASLPTTIVIQAELEEDVGTILADSTHIHQVIMNLGANAEYAMRDTGGALYVSLQTVEVDADATVQYPGLQPGPHIRLTVRDTGPGMPPDVRERIFEPFFTTKKAGEGTGMGLAVVHGIITSYGGAIAVQSTPGAGTSFEIYLPQLSARADAEVTVESSFPYGQGSILFVDDEETLSALGQHMLEYLGYDVVVSRCSREALEIFRLSPYRFDLVITDQTMPHMTGEVLARELRDIRPDIPIILCTGFSHTMDAEKAAAQGIDAFLIKPLLARDLGLVIQHVLSRRL
jgi:PAS domain S-box-containing protein